MKGNLLNFKGSNCLIAVFHIVIWLNIYLRLVRIRICGFVVESKIRLKEQINRN